MGRGGASATVTELPTLPVFRNPRARLTQLITMRREAPTKAPLYFTSDDISVGAALRIGLLHNLRGAPSQDRNAVISNQGSEHAMLSVFAGHGKHGSRLAELAATVVSRQLKRRLASAEQERTSGSFHKAYPAFDDSMEQSVDDAFVEANIAVDATQWSRNSGATATVCLLRKGRLVVGTCGEPCVMVVTKRSGKVQIRLLSDSHHIDQIDEKARVERFGGLVKNGSVSDEDGRYTLPFTRSLGDLEMRSSGVCQVPTIRSFDVNGRDTHIILSTQRLWSGSSLLAPPPLVDVMVRKGDACVVDLAEALMQVAFGVSGPTHDATILCARLK